jgi:hypothetical protein
MRECRLAICNTQRVWHHYIPEAMVLELAQEDKTSTSDKVFEHYADGKRVVLGSA